MIFAVLNSWQLKRNWSCSPFLSTVWQCAKAVFILIWLFTFFNLFFYNYYSKDYQDNKFKADWLKVDSTLINQELQRVWFVDIRPWSITDNKYPFTAVSNKPTHHPIHPLVSRWWNIECYERCRTILHMQHIEAERI